MQQRTCSARAGLMLALMLVPRPVLAQITTGTVAGNVNDTQGSVIPGATVILISSYVLGAVLLPAP